MKNQEIAQIFYEIASYLEMEGVAPVLNFASKITATPSPAKPLFGAGRRESFTNFNFYSILNNEC